MAKYSIGDVVQLITGGPQMLVFGAVDPTPEAPDNISCGFYDNGEFTTKKFPEDALILIPKNSYGPGIGNVRCLYSAPDE